MTYKSTHQNHDFMNRVANHSTKGSRRGFATIGLLINESDLKDDPMAVRKQLHAMKERLIAQRTELEKSLCPRDTAITRWRKNIKSRYKGREHVFGESTKANQLREYFKIGELLEDIANKYREFATASADGRSPYKRLFETILVDEMKKEMSEEAFQNAKNRAHKIYKSRK